ncbi:hypothetical protein [Daejeonella sp.]|uniref:hypothetical protein n=1 Tax=Daejeonella sp. TaxID=2805397 RepID=UPI0030BBFCEB
MKNFDKHEFDEIFRAGLISPYLNEVDEDWALMKGRLQSQKSRNTIPSYIIFVSAIAAVFLLVLAVIFNSDDFTQDQPDINANADSKTGPALKAPNRVEIVTESTPAKSPFSAPGRLLLSTPNVYYSNFESNAEVEAPAQSTLAAQVITADIPKATDPSNNTSVPAVLAPDAGDVSSSVNGEVAVSEKPLSADDVPAADEEEEDNTKSNSSKSRFSLAVNFAPDLNGVEQLQNNKLSYSLGAGLIYKVSNKLSIEAGAAYGKKTYQTGFSSFRPASYNHFQVKPNIVSSGFDVMDIQLNLAYTLLNKGKSSIGLGAGISSYLMLDEQYSFTYQNLNARGLSSFRTGYQNNHFFGIANLSLSYKRSLTNNVKLAFNPYLKLPLTDLGYGNIRLRSAGMSVGVITNLNKSKK